MSDPRRRLPAVDALLAEPEIAALVGPHPRSVVVRAVRETLEAARVNGGTPPAEGWARAVADRVTRLGEPSLAPVVNATGVVLHTNLGRSLLAPVAAEAMTRVALSYAALEYDVGRGARGARHLHCRDLLVELTGAEEAFVVNNAAGALLLALSALARGGDAIVSRGELVEVGGSFRIPDILARSGAKLVEVGTTNRTHREDYASAVGPGTRLLLKVHRSNFRVTGFTAEVSAADVAALAGERRLASLYDLGSGLLLDLSAWGLAGEPTVQDALASGADLVVFSADKLLGGPQAGILVGRRETLESCRHDPVARAVRADKFTLAALGATLALYRDPERARREIPTLRMLTESPEDIRRRAEQLAAAIESRAAPEVRAAVSEVGGGSFPGAELPTWVVLLAPRELGAQALTARLREFRVPVIGRIEHDRVALDARTILPDQILIVAAAAAAACDAPP